MIVGALLVLAGVYVFIFGDLKGKKHRFGGSETGGSSIESGGKVAGAVLQQGRRGAALDGPLHRVKVYLAGDQAQDRHKDAVNQRGDDGGKRGADDHTYCEVDDVALERKRLKLVPKLLHEKTSLNNSYSNYMLPCKEFQ